MKRLAEPELGGPWSAAAANRQVCFSRHVRHLTALRGGSSSRQRLGEARSGVGRLGTVAEQPSTAVAPILVAYARNLLQLSDSIQLYGDVDKEWYKERFFITTCCSH